MAVVAKMRCHTVTRRSYGLYLPCDPEAEGAVEITEPEKPNLPFWFKGATHKRFDDSRTSQVTWEMNPVYSTDPEHENRQFAQASPSGKFELMVENPAVMDYVKEGYEYRITIERVRGPREAD